MKKTKSKKIYFKKALITFLAFSFVFVSFPQKTEAVWIPAVESIIRTGLETLRDNILGIITVGMKKAAITMINKQIDKLMGHKGGAFITNWNVYIVNNSKNKASVYLNDYLSQSTNGRDKSSGYTSTTYNHREILASGAKTKVTTSNSVKKPTYEKNPSEMFSNGNLKDMEKNLSSVNNSWAYNIAASEAYTTAYEENKEVALARAQAYQGYKGTTDANGRVVFPGSNAKDEVSKARGMSFDTIVKANNPGEVISAVVVGALTQAFQKGFDSMQDKYINDEESGETPS